MKYHKAPDTEYLKCRFISEDEKYEIGIFPVIFGWRVHAGIINSGWYNIDYCCGDKPENIRLLLTIVKFLLEKHNNDFNIFPIQNKKPIFTDTQCFSKLLELCGNYIDYDNLIEIPNISTLRHEIMSNIYNKKYEN